MNREIDMSKYQIRTDLVVEMIEKNNSIDQKIEQYNDIKVTTFNLKNNEGKSINKKDGNYITIEYKDVTDEYNRKALEEIFIKYLKELMLKNNIKDTDKVLIIGLGNSKSTPDSLGPLVLKDIIVTGYLKEISDNYRIVSTFAPNVTGVTGIETGDLIKSVININKPDFVIVIDSLASSSIDRVNKTIQLTDTGITPGSGVGNDRKEISKEVFNIPVIAIGVPTVVDAVTIVSDTINYMYEHFKYLKKNLNDPKHKLIVNNNYLEENLDKVEIDTNLLFGLIGNLSAEEFESLIFEVLTPLGYNFMVTPKEIDFVIEKLSKLIADGVNKSIHFIIE